MKHQELSCLPAMHAALVGSACLLAMAPVHDARAQSAAAGATGLSTLEEVVVTAQRRAENLQDVPIAVTAIGGDQLEASGVQTTMALDQVVPGLHMTRAIGTYGLPFIRGEGTTSQGAGVENPVATYIDGVYVYGTAGTVLTLHDIDQIAVLKGPQGTLFGRNATGGLLQYTTKAPSHTAQLDVEGTLGNLSSSGANLYATTGLSDTVAVNVAASIDGQQEGFGRNLYNGQWVYTHTDVAARSKLLWQPSDKTDVTLSADYSSLNAAQPVNRMSGRTVLNQPMPGGPWNTDLDVQPISAVWAGGASLTIRHDFGGARLLSISAFRFDRIHTQFDADGTELNIQELQGRATDENWSQEIQLLSPDGNRFTWVVGAFGLGAHTDSLSDNFGWYFGPRGSNSWTQGHQQLTSYAAFAQGTLKLNETTNLTAGLRYSWDSRTADQTTYAGTWAGPTGAPTGGAYPGGLKFSDPTYRLSVDHHFTADTMGYLSYNHGFRSGQFGSLGNVATSTKPFTPATPVNPETLDAYEVGVKTDLLDHHLRLNTSAYYYQDHDRVSFQIINGTSTLLDAKLATLYGADVDALWQFNERFSLNVGVELEHAVYTSFGTAACVSSTYQFGCGTVNTPLATPSLPQNNIVIGYGNDSGKYVEATPSMTFNLGPSFHVPTAVGDFKATFNYYYNNGWWAAPDNFIKQGSYSTLAADILWMPSFSKNFTARAWGANLTNSNYAEQYTETALGPNYQVAPGRTFGISVALHL